MHRPHGFHKWNQPHGCHTTSCLLLDNGYFWRGDFTRAKLGFNCASQRSNRHPRSNVGAPCNRNGGGVAGSQDICILLAVPVLQPYFHIVRHPVLCIWGLPAEEPVWELQRLLASRIKTSLDWACDTAWLGRLFQWFQCRNTRNELILGLLQSLFYFYFYLDFQLVGTFTTHLCVIRLCCFNFIYFLGFQENLTKGRIVVSGLSWASWLIAYGGPAEQRIYHTQNITFTLLHLQHETVASPVVWT